MYLLARSVVLLLIVVSICCYTIDINVSNLHVNETQWNKTAELVNERTNAFLHMLNSTVNDSLTSLHENIVYVMHKMDMQMLMLTKSLNHTSEMITRAMSEEMQKNMNQMVQTIMRVTFLTVRSVQQTADKGFSLMKDISKHTVNMTHYTVRSLSQSAAQIAVQLCATIALSVTLLGMFLIIHNALKNRGSSNEKNFHRFVETFQLTDLLVPLL